jgi:two-component system response regulator RegA
MSSATGEPGERARNYRSTPDGKSRLLIVDDNESHCSALQRAFERRGYAVKAANCVAHAESLLAEWEADYAVIDLRMPGPCGMTLIGPLKRVQPEVRIVVTTGYGSIATAVAAIKLGAVHYLTKPVDADMIELAFHRRLGDENVPPAQRPPSVPRLAWEHIQSTLAHYGGNISAAARALGMHRRTLQRKLDKHPTRL